MPYAGPTKEVVKYVTPDHLKHEVAVLEERVSKLRAEIGLLNDVRSLQQVIEDLHGDLEAANAKIVRAHEEARKFATETDQKLKHLEAEQIQRHAHRMKEISTKEATLARERQVLAEGQATAVIQHNEQDAREVRLGKMKADLDIFSNRLLEWQDEIRAVSKKADDLMANAQDTFAAAAEIQDEAARSIVIVSEKEESLKAWTDELSDVQKQNDRDAKANTERHTAILQEQRILAADRAENERIKTENTARFQETEALWKKAEEATRATRQKERELRETAKNQEHREAELIKREGRVRERERLVEGARDHLVKKAGKDVAERS